MARSNLQQLAGQSMDTLLNINKCSRETHGLPQHAALSNNVHSSNNHGGSDVVFIPTPCIQITLSQAVEANAITDSINPTLSGIQESIKNRTFWFKFKTVKSPGDGHCLLHSLVTSLRGQKSVHSDLTFANYDINTLLTKLKEEVLANKQEYLPYIEGQSNLNLFTAMLEYVYRKCYDSAFGDLVPSIMSNALEKNIIIVECETNTLTVTTVGKQKHCTNDFVVLLKNGHHYDGLVLNQGNKLEDVNVTAINSPPYDSTLHGTNDKIKYYLGNQPAGNHTNVLNHSIPEVLHKGTFNVLGLNVNGLHSKLQLGILEEYVNNFDIACFSETMTNTIYDDAIPGYSSIVMSK